MNLVIFLGAMSPICLLVVLCRQAREGAFDRAERVENGSGSPDRGWSARD